MSAKEYLAGRKRAVAKPRLERTWERAGVAAPVAHAPGKLLVAGRDVAEHQVAVTGDLLRRARERHVRTEIERALQERARGGVVHDRERARGAGGLRELREVVDLELGVRGGLEPEQRGPIGGRGQLGRRGEP